MVAAVVFVIANFTFISFFISICEHHRAFYHQFVSFVARIHKKIQNHQNVKQELCELVHFHVQITR